MRKVMYENDEIKIDNGLFFGKGVFETILVNKKPVFLEEHVKRLNNAIEALNIGEKIEIEEVRSFIIKNKIVNKSFKIAVTEENLIFNIRNLKYTKDHYENGFKAYFSNFNTYPPLASPAGTENHRICRAFMILSSV